MSRVLVVEDSPTQAAELLFGLEDIGFEVETAPDGAGALTKLAEQEYDAIVADVVMPGMSGYELCHAIRNAPRYKTLPVLMLTTLNGVDDIARGLSCGADAYLIKPCPPQKLAERLRDILSRPSGPRPATSAHTLFNGRSIDLPAGAAGVADYLFPLLADFAAGEKPTDASSTGSQQALRRSEERFALAAAGANDGLWDWQLGAEQLYCSPRFREIAGLSPDGPVFLGNLHGRVHPEDVNHAVEAFIEFVQSGAKQFRHECRLRTADEGASWVLIRGCVLRDGNGKPYRAAGSLTDITLQMAAKEQLEISQNSLQLLSRRLFRVLEQERTMVAHQLHSRIGQLLGAAKLPLRELAERDADDTRNASANVRNIAGLVNSALQGVFSLANELRSAILGGRGLVPGVRSYVEGFEATSKVSCELSLPPAGDILISGQRAASLFRILQEGLANVSQHSAATQVHVDLSVTEDAVVLSISDNGRGIDPAAVQAPDAVGIIGMRERARQWGGDVEVGGIPGQGTTITARVPFHDQPADEHRLSA